MPVFQSSSEDKVQVGRKKVVANSLRHLHPDCKVLAATGESSDKQTRANKAFRTNTAKLKRETALCPVCWVDYDDPRGFAEGVEVPTEIAGRVAAKIAAKRQQREANQKRGKEAPMPAAKKGGKSAAVAAKAKAARAKKPATKRSGVKVAA